jgi:hypothetical protein
VHYPIHQSILWVHTVDEITHKNQILFSILDSVSVSFERLNFDSFDTLFPVMVNKMKKAQKMKEELILEYGVENLMPFDKELSMKAKLIQTKFDNLVRIISVEQRRLEKDLQGIVGAKKLTNYERYQNGNQRTF